MKPTFDRRAEDVNYAAVGVRIQALEDHVHESMTPELRANTRLTQQVHEALMGRGEALGIIGKVEEMHEAYMAAKGGFRVLETMGKVAKPLIYTIALVAAVYGLITGHAWEWPKP